jgi:small redox-active disulfide protein 2
VKTEPIMQLRPIGVIHTPFKKCAGMPVQPTKAKGVAGTIRFEKTKQPKKIPMKIQILGTGCAKCNALTMTAQKAAQALGIEYELEKVTDLQRIMSFGVMMTPALVVDGAVRVSGKVPSLDEVKKLLVGAKS